MERKRASVCVYVYACLRACVCVCVRARVRVRGYMRFDCVRIDAHALLLLYFTLRRVK
jgi:hypothetical protein